MKPPDALLQNYGGQLKDCFAMGKEGLDCDFSSLATVLGEGGSSHFLTLWAHLKLRLLP